MYDNDKRVVLTLDAGGTNFQFSAIQGNKHVVESLNQKSNPDDLEKCLSSISAGFKEIITRLDERPLAISFAFPGPADYENGIIGDLPNFPSFRGGVALGPFLQKEFGLPVFINNDGNLFAYGEALAGELPRLNNELASKGSKKEYKNLLGLTIGTGFGAGVVVNNTLLTGDNGCGGDVWCGANKFDAGLLAEEGVSVRGIKNFYQRLSGESIEVTPEEIFEIAEGEKLGNQSAAIGAFSELGKVAGYTIAEALNIVDGIVVIGGGIAGAYKYFMPSLIEEIRLTRKSMKGDKFPRVQMIVFNLMDAQQREAFIENESDQIKIPNTSALVTYNYKKKTGIIISSRGATESISLGAYAFALQQLDRKKYRENNLFRSL